MTIRCGCAFGKGSARPAIVARMASAGIAASQVSTGNSEGREASGGLTVGLQDPPAHDAIVVQGYPQVAATDQQREGDGDPEVSHPLVAPDVSPSMKRRCSSRKSAIPGASTMMQKA